MQQYSFKKSQEDLFDTDQRFEELEIQHFH